MEKQVKKEKLDGEQVTTAAANVKLESTMPTTSSSSGEHQAKSNNDSSTSVKSEHDSAQVKTEKNEKEEVEVEEKKDPLLNMFYSEVYINSFVVVVEFRVFFFSIKGILSILSNAK